MQTANIKIGELYAITTPNHGVVRFKPTSIRTVTMRYDKKKPDTTNYITGEIEEGDMPGTTVTERTRELSPDLLLDHYTAYTDLQAKQAEETRLKEEEEQRKRDLTERLRAKLYEVTGMVRPVKPTEKWATYNEPFGSQYGGHNITIGIETMQIVLETLERIPAYAEATN